MTEEKPGTAKPILFVHSGHDLYGSGRMLILNIEAVQIKYPEKEIMVILPQKGMLAESVAAMDNVTVVIKKIGVVRKYDLRRFNFSAFLKILTFFRLIKMLNSFDLVYINTLVVADYILAARYCKTRVIIHIHELPGPLSAHIFNAMLGFSRANLVFVSAASKNSLNKLTNSKQFILWNGCRPLQSTSGAVNTDGRIRILLIGRINKGKGQPLLINAINLLTNEEREKVRVRIVGDVYGSRNHLKERLFRMIEVCQLQNTIEILDFTLHPEIHYNWADVVIIPSICPESFGLVAIEAMSLKKMVIAANHGGVKEIVEDHARGILFEPGNEKDLAEKISGILGAPDTIKEFGEKGYKEFTEKFTEETYISKLAKII